MAEGALIDVAKVITEKVGSLVAEEIGLLWSLKDEIEKLGNTVSTIRLVLQDAEEKQHLNDEVRGWLKRLNDAFYEADDLLDDFSTEASRREMMTRNKKAKEVRIFFSKSNQLAYGLKMGHKVKAMRERLDAIKKDRGFHLDERPVETQDRGFHFDERPVETQVGGYRARETHSSVRSEEVIGRDNDKDEIKKILLDPNVEGNVSILPIVGLGGLGKTTLAQLVFNDEKIQNHFEQKLWVCVSDDFKEKVIVKKILECAQHKKQEELELNTLIDNLKKEIDGKRYLLVLDDVWNENLQKWLKLKSLLMGGASGSRILVTTRSDKVVEITKTVGPYMLQGLDNDKSWSLLKEIAFENGQEPENSKFKVVGMEILEKCRGVPLAIRTIGSVLRFEKTLEKWSSFKDNELSKLAQNEDDILPTLKLSYNHLELHLKQCFAYCCLFPKDYKIHKKTLIQMWMAQGFIRPLNPNQCLEDVGHEYIMDLLLRSFFQEVEKDERGNIIQFKMHDLMHDLAKLVAGSYSTTCYSKEQIIDEKTLHVSFGGQSQSQIPSSLFKASRIRTFMSQGQVGGLDKPIYKSTIVASFKFIRLLDLHRMCMGPVPNSIGELKHLRYLDLSNNLFISMLPNSITRLHNLQTLKLYKCSAITKLPSDFIKLVNLRLLEIDTLFLTHIPHGLGQMTGLKGLSTFRIRMNSNSHNSEWKELHGLNELRDLTISNLNHGKEVALESKAANLKGKQQLQRLDLKWKRSSKVSELSVGYDEQSLEAMQPHPKLEELVLCNYGGAKFPSWMSSLTNLVIFSLEDCNKCQHLPPLEQFHFLKCLFLDKLDSLEYMSEIDYSEELSNSSFIPSLKELKLSCCPNLKGWWRQGRDSLEEVIDKNHLLPFFPGLFHLNIRNCPKLTSMPWFPNVINLKLDMCSLKPLNQTLTLQISNSSFAPLSNLRYLETGTLKEPLPNLSNIFSLCCRGPPPQGMQYLTSLTDMKIEDSTEVDLSKFWDVVEWQGLKSLQSLEIRSCPNLLSLPEGMGGLTSLQKLEIGWCDKLKSLPEGMHGLASLQKLEIKWCDELKSLPKGVGGLTSLQTLHIVGCPKLTSLPEGMGGLSSLQTLHISDCHKLKSLPKGIQGLTSLNELHIWDCSKLKSLPEGIQGLTSLHTLYIWDCPKLKSLPKGIQGLTSLTTLKIDNCPILLKRCERETGEDWSKIAHIPNLEGDLRQHQTN